MENILQGARSATSPRPLFLFSRKRPLLFILVFFHPPSLPSSFPPRFYFNSHCFFLPHDAQTRVHSGNRRKALVALPFFPILLPYCLSRYSRVESESGSQLVFSQSWLIKPFFFTSPWIRYTGLFNYEEFIREESSFYYLTRFSLSSSLILSSFDNRIRSFLDRTILQWFYPTFSPPLFSSFKLDATHMLNALRHARLIDLRGWRIELASNLETDSIFNLEDTSTSTSPTSIGIKVHTAKWR